MGVQKPKLPENLTDVSAFSVYASEFLWDETPVNGIQCSNDSVEGAALSKIEIRKSLFDHCSFQTCNFENAGFIDVVFQSCDLSNSRFTGAYFERCRFYSCKGIGTDFGDTLIKHTSFEQCNLKFSSFDQSKMTDIVFDQVDFTEASMMEAQLKRFGLVNSRWIKNNLFKTMLNTVDFTESELIAPIVSNPPVELKGAVVNLFQAADLIGLLGVVVKRD